MSHRYMVQGQARHLFLAIAWTRPPPELVEQVAGIQSAEVWEAAAGAALRIDQEPLFLRFLLDHCPEAPVSRETRSRLDAQDRYHAFRWAEIRDCLGDVIRILAGAGIRPVLMKGVACVGDIYSPARLRPMRDIDLLVRPEQVERAGDLLRDRGYTHRVDHPAAAYLNHHHVRPFFHPSSGICVELHHRPLSPSASLPGAPVIEEFWTRLRQNRVPSAMAAQAEDLVADHAATFEATLQALVTSLHFTHADSIAARISHLFDLARLIELHSGEVDWERLLRYASSPGIARSLSLSFGFLAGAGLPTAPPDILQRLREAARYDWWERRLLVELIHRYRITIPSPWPRISTRIADILWTATIRSGNSVGRTFDIFRFVFLGPGRHSQPQFR